MQKTKESRVRQGMQMEQKPHWCHILFFGRESAQMFFASKFSKRRSLMVLSSESGKCYTWSLLKPGVFLRSAAHGLCD